MDKEALGQLLVTLRRSANMSQNDLARELFVTQPAVSKWETGQSIPDIEKITKIAELFHISTDILLNPETFSRNLRI